ncbi:hypothetical protein IQ03_00117 [Gemmobacter caeni]|uniref:Uncharacterized protein n=1 Tax=Gemmobacter caeni TaxID=589035 RepID=A0A2T6BAW6_9RHOB|nr:hypothetical protein [Gemmobacter caeni]PTX53207.1 hypothetical protein C8N34_101119 [Gemmobacter caeni]TWJ05318.1 hypothetical protein IQ03_00117 [Gemmobacter caeni]
MRFCATALFALLATPLAADPFVMTYEAFEQAVPHIDLPACPVDLDGPGRFCRLTTHNDALNVFVFSEDGDQPLVALKSWPADLLAGLMD